MVMMNNYTIELRVRYKETDQMGLVYYANYLVWFEIARTEFFRAGGIEYRKMEEEDKIYMPVVEAYCRYRSPLRYDDLVKVTVKLADVGKTRVTFDYEVRSGGELKATGSTNHAFLNGKGKPIPVPAMVREVFSG
ncbi:MAG: thioesterase family protein [Candidatus Omnitrophota bacterium]|nr:thioesterase family protein [Candidatus Omnitrophota bacterium]